MLRFRTTLTGRNVVRLSAVQKCTRTKPSKMIMPSMSAPILVRNCQTIPHFAIHFKSSSWRDHGFGQAAAEFSTTSKPIVSLVETNMTTTNLNNDLRTHSTKPTIRPPLSPQPCSSLSAIHHYHDRHEQILHYSPDQLLQLTNDLLTVLAPSDNATSLSKLDVALIRSAMNAWIAERRPRLQKNDFALGAKQAERLLMLLRSCCDENGVCAARTVHYSIVLEGYSKAVEVSSSSSANSHCEAAERVLKLMQADYQSQLSSTINNTAEASCPPNRSCYFTVLQAWCAVAKPNRAESIVRSLVHENSQGNNLKDIAQPTTAMYNKILHGYAYQNNGMAAEHLLQFMRAQSQNHSNSPAPTSHSYGIVIHAYGRMKSVKSAQNAERILNLYEDEWKRLHSTSTSSNTQTPGHIQATSIPYVNAMLAYSKSGHHRSGPQCETLFARIAKISREFPHLSEDFMPGGQHTLYTYNALIEGWGNCGHPQKCRDLLNLLLQDHELQPSVITWTLVVNAYALAGLPRECEAIVEEMQSLVQTKEDDNRKEPPTMPNEYTYNAVLNAWRRSSLPDAPERAHAILRHMQDPQSGTTAKPSEVSHTIVIDTYGANGNPMAVQELLDDMYVSADKEAEGDGTDSYSGRRARHVLPNSITYRSLMNSWIRYEHDEDSSVGLRNAVKLLHQMIDRYKEHNDKNARPDSLCVDMILDACEKPHVSGISQKALAEISQEALDVAVANESILGVFSRIKSFHSVILAWCKCNNLDKAEDALHQLEKWSQKHNGLHGGLVAKNYNEILRAWAVKSGNGYKKAPKRADRLLEEMEDKWLRQHQNQAVNKETLYDNHVDKIEDDKVDGFEDPIWRATTIAPSFDFENLNSTYSDQNALSLAAAESNDSSSPSPSNQNTLISFNKHTLLLRPDIRSYHWVLSSWKNVCGDQAAAKVERILNRMIYGPGQAESQSNGSGNGNGDDISTSTSNISPFCMPNIKTYELALSTCAQCQNQHSGEIAERIVAIMNQMYADHKKEHSPEHPSDSAKEQPQQKKKKKRSKKAFADTPPCPNTATVHLLLQSILASDDTLAPKKAEKLFRYLVTQYQDHNNTACRPTTIFFNSVLEAWLRNDYQHPLATAPQRMEKAVAYVENEAKKGNFILDPNAETYNLILHAWYRYAKRAKPNEIHMAWKNARRVLSQMSDHKRVHPNLRSYTFVLLACSHAAGIGDVNERTEALDKAIEVFYELRELADNRKSDISMSPNHISYHTFLSACLKLSRDKSANKRSTDEVEKSTKLAKLIFQECCGDGQVDKNILKLLRKELTKDEFRRCLLDGARNNLDNDGMLQVKMNDKFVSDFHSRNLLKLTIDDLPSEWSRNLGK